LRKLLSRVPSARWSGPLLAALVVPLIVGILTQEKQYWWAIAVTLVSAAIVGYITWPGLYNRSSLERALTALPTYLGFQEDARVHCALYAPVIGAGGDFLHSVTDYMPDGEKLAGFRLHSSKGIVGLAFRLKKTCVEILDDPKFDDPAFFESYLVERWGFTREEAQKLPKERRAYLASPVLTSDKVVLGVIFMETVHAAVFRDNAGLPDWVEGLAPFFHELLAQRGG
jgi:hypothetical protein